MHDTLAREGAVVRLAYGLIAPPPPRLRRLCGRLRLVEGSSVSLTLRSCPVSPLPATARGGTPPASGPSTHDTGSCPMRERISLVPFFTGTPWIVVSWIASRTVDGTGG